MRRAHGRTLTWRTALPVAGGVAVLGFGGLYVTGLVVAGDDIAAGTRVQGIDIGGMSRAEAGRVLDRELGPTAAAPIPLRIGDRTEQALPAAFGLSLDTEATAERAARTGADPFTVIGRLFAEPDRDVEPVVRTDGPTDRAALDRLTAARKARDGVITFDDGAPKVTQPVTGVTLRPEQAVNAVHAAYLTPRTGPVTVPVQQTPPRVGAAETARALKEFAEPAMSGPVTLTLAGHRITLTPEVLGRHLTVEPDQQGRLVPSLDAKGLLADPELARQLEAAAPGPTDATFRTDAQGKVSVVDGRPGVEVTEEALRTAVLPLLTRTGDTARTAELAATSVQPDLTAASAARLGIKEKVSSFTVAFPAAPYRTTNIARAVELINGSVVRPGETWSFNKTVGERTKENGFVDGIMINDGRYVKSPGGGVSAVATTMYNAAFFAGVKPVEHGAHSFYIERYPEGREATVAWGSLDLRWLNDSGNALYVQASSTDTSVTITLLGTKKYDEVRSEKGERTNVVKPAKREGSGPTCEVQTPYDGFDVSVDRILMKAGQEVGRQTYRTHYTPRDEITCTPTPSPTT
ncbi:VanW family protein, partial [Streptomyces sp. WAC06614]|uniref:VanW family protein n=1 Tax=Streptomyces sp. WAC06614 TaxID=2487416 RepID=UPI000F771A23